MQKGQCHRWKKAGHSEILQPGPAAHPQQKGGRFWEKHLRTKQGPQEGYHQWTEKVEKSEIILFKFNILNRYVDCA